MLGVELDWPTIGVTKKRLFGRVDISALSPGASRPVIHDGETLGVALLGKTGTARPLYVSPGHRVNVDSAADVVARLLAGRRLPVPIYWADRLSRAAARGGVWGSGDRYARGLVCEAASGPTTPGGSFRDHR